MVSNIKLSDTGASETVEDSFQAFLVNGAKFTKNEEYPVLRADMISEEIPCTIMPFDRALNSRRDLSKVFVCTYAHDKTFERVRRHPKRYLSFFKRTAGIIGFDYSIHSDMPVIKQKSQIDDNLSLTYFYGNSGIPIIPNLRCGIDELLPEFFEAIPKHVMVAIGTHGFCQKIREKAEWYCFIERVLEVLSPTDIIVYGSLNGSMFDGLKEKCRFTFFEPWLYKFRKKVKLNGYKRC